MTCAYLVSLTISKKTAFSDSSKCLLCNAHIAYIVTQEKSNCITVQLCPTETQILAGLNI